MIRTIIKNRVRGCALNRKRLNTRRTDLDPILSVVGNALSSLTADEKRQIDNRRNLCGIRTKPTYKYWELYKTFCGFDPDFIADDDYIPLIIRSLNPNPYYHSYEYKGTYSIYFRGLHQPRTILSSISGIWYDAEMNVVGKSEKEVERLFEQEEEFIIKPTMGTSSGKGVVKLNAQKENELFAKLSLYGKNFICQSVVKQSHRTARFNQSSLNTFRFSSLNINGRCSVVNRLFRHGQSGFCCDNGGAGGTMIGIDDTGQFSAYGMNKSLKKTDKSATGIKYADVKIEGFADLINFVENVHRKYLPNMGFVGWDFALDDQDEPVFIECNLAFPGIMFEQICSSSPIFAERTEEVYAYTKERIGNLSTVYDLLSSSYTYEK